MIGVVSKSEAAAAIGVSPSRLSHWLREGKIDGEAIVGEGRLAKIDVELAKRQLDARLNLGQRLGANGRAQLDRASPDPVDVSIKSARLRQLTLANERAAEEAKLREGRYLEADAARTEMGAIAGRTVASLEGGLPELASALAGQFQLPHRDVLHALRAAWRALRARLAEDRRDAATTPPGPESVEAAR